MVEINEQLTIPDEELSFEFSRSGGPGGQNVNKVSTKATLLFDVEASPSLTDVQRSRIMSRLRTRITKTGILRVSSQRHRTQRANREAAVERFAELIGEALHPKRPRRRTRMPKAVKERRLQEKKRRGELKRRRGAVRSEE
jgi:ribosome-associated protein